MGYFFLSIAIVTGGGILPLFFWHRFTLSRAMGVAGIVCGCLVGLVDASGYLLRAGNVRASFNYLHTFTLAFRIDPLSAFFLMVILTVCSLAALYSFNYLENPQKALRTAVHYLFFALLTAAMALVVTADNLITFLLAWEIMSLSSFFLVLYDYEAPRNRRAGYLYFVFSHVGVLFIFAAFGLIYAHTGSLNFEAAASLPETTRILTFALAFIGFGSKAGVFPFHVWLPHAHPAAPSHISAVMSGVMIKMGIYGILRIYMLLDWHTALFGEIVLIAGMVSGILGVVYALAQHDLKRLLAYSSVENIGIVLIGMGIGMLGVAGGKPVMAVLGFGGGLLHVLNHAVFKSLLFMGAGMVLHRTGTLAMDTLGGLIKNMRITGTTFLIGSLAISGLPPFNGFVSEFMVYLGGFDSVGLRKADFALGLLAVVSLAVIGGLALACFTKVLGVVFQGEPRTAVADVREKGGMMLASMIVLAAACTLIGLLPMPFAAMALKAVAGLNLGYGRIPPEPFASLALDITRAAALLLLVLTVLTLVRAYLYRGKNVRRSATWGCGFSRPTARMQYTSASYAASIVEFFRPVAPLVEDHPPIQGRFPTRTHYRSEMQDAAELLLNRVIVQPVMWLFDRLRWLQHGDIHMYIGYILLAIVVLLFFV